MSFLFSIFFFHMAMFNNILVLNKVMILLKVIVIICFGSKVVFKFSKIYINIPHMSLEAAYCLIHTVLKF